MKKLRFKLVDIIDNYRHELKLPPELKEKAKDADIIVYSDDERDS